MSNNELNVTLLNHEDIKSSLIDFLKSTNEFSDFDYDGSAINTIIDLLTRDTVYTAYLANMLANESFIDSAQLRQNVVSHAQKLSYTPRSSTAARLVCDVTVRPADVSNAPNSIVMEAGSVFLTSIEGQTFSFTNKESYILTFSSTESVYKASAIELFQGQLVSNKFVYQSEPVIVPNLQCDTSTLRVSVDQQTEQGSVRVYTKADSITELGSENAVYFLSETPDLKAKIAFGKDILGAEPPVSSIVTASYIATEEEHANGVNSLVAASTIAGYSDVQVNVTTNSYGGQERENIEDIRFVAPKFYQTQDRAVSPSDYSVILRKQFPFIKSAFAWGGETNVPPVYGTVFISVLSEGGELITNAVKNQMEAYVKDRNVGSVTPKIVDPEVFNIDVTVKFSYDERKTSKTFNELKVLVADAVTSYNQRVNDFGEYFNNSEVIDKIKDIKGIVSVVVDKVAYHRIDVLRFESPVYSIEFGNPITEGSLSMTDFKVNPLGTNHKLYDADGEIFVSYLLDSQTVTQSVGTIDYETGEVEFTTDMVQSETTVDLYITPQDENFYVDQNKVININNVDSELLVTNKRNQ